MMGEADPSSAIVRSHRSAPLSAGGMSGQRAGCPVRLRASRRAPPLRIGKKLLLARTAWGNGPGRSTTASHANHIAGLQSDGPGRGLVTA